METSRRGGHLWVHFYAPAPAQRVRAWLLPYASALGVELYPKQDMLAPDGSGSLIRLPLGIHRQSRGWYPFLTPDACGQWVPVGETVEACCTWVIVHVEQVAVPDIVVTLFSNEVTVSAFAHIASHWSADGGRGSIRAWCQAQDIVEVIGRGVGSCPFKEYHHRGDRRPSFQVFGGSDPHWYCYTWRRAGDLFDFLCLYYQIAPREAWERLRNGTLL